jgi:perosamine synthetase
MWSRKRLDICGSDLLAAAAYALVRWRPRTAQAALEQEFSPAGDALACLSVRSAWDLLLQSLDLKPGDEVLMSALTIPDMVRIVEHHGLVPVPLDLDVDSAAPSLETLERAITPRARVVLVAHLFGGRIDLDAFIDSAKTRGLTVVEDCAQAYVGPEFRGHPRADLSLFSFGTIKTATALGGGLAVVRDPALLERMRSRQAGYDVQGRWKFLKRVGKSSLLKVVSTRRLFGVFVRLCRALGIDYDRMVNNAVRGFAPGTSGAAVDRFRQRPSPPLLALLRRRIRRYDPRRVAAKTERGERLAGIIQPAVRSPGAALDPHNYWVFPVWSEDPPATIARLNRAGFDATQGQSMCVIPAPAGRGDLEPVHTRELLEHLVYVPLYAEVPVSEIDRLGQAVRADAAERAERRAEPVLA